MEGFEENKRQEWGGKDGERITCGRSARCCPRLGYCEYSTVYGDGVIPMIIDKEIDRYIYIRIYDV
jgi:hypothetical protein